jgi:hypothetical protein
MLPSPISTIRFSSKLWQTTRNGFQRKIVEGESRQNQKGNITFWHVFNAAFVTKIFKRYNTALAVNNMCSLFPLLGTPFSLLIGLSFIAQLTL